MLYAIQNENNGHWLYSAKSRQFTEYFDAATLYDNPDNVKKIIKEINKSFDAKIASGMAVTWYADGVYYSTGEDKDYVTAPRPVLVVKDFILQPV